MDIQSYISNCSDLVNKSLDVLLPEESSAPSAELHKAMRYAVLNGGKRLRSAYIYGIGQALGAKEKTLTQLCVVIELIHSFSLIHDDLPALDNDDLRRGLPSCHMAFGEATAILTGDALQSLAFETLAKITDLSSDLVLKMVKVLAHSIGVKGMVGGEELDIKMVNQKVSIEEVEAMYSLKTGYLLSACAQLAALAASCDDEKVLSQLNNFGYNIGISFQIHDDIIGIESDTETLGKKQKADLELNKPVYPALVGIDAAKRRRDELYNQAITCLEEASCGTEILKKLSAYAINRTF